MKKAPLVHIRPQVWKKGQLAYWERMAVRVNILHQTHHKKVARDLTSMLSTLNDNASEDMEQDLFATLLSTWIKEPCNDPTELKRYIQNQEHQAIKHCSAPVVPSSRPGSRKHTRKASEDSSGIFARGTFPGNVPFKIYQLWTDSELGKSNGERFGGHLMVLVTFEDSRPSRQQQLIMPLESHRSTPVSCKRFCASCQTKLLVLMVLPMTS